MTEIGGYDLGWDRLAARPPEEVCLGAGARNNAAEPCFVLESFGGVLSANLAQRTAGFQGLDGAGLSEETLEHLIPAFLWYLAKAQAIPLSGHLVPAENLPGGQMFVKGTHVLPLDRLAEKYGHSLPALLDHGRRWGGISEDYGDAALRLFPLPRVPVVLVCWSADEEFPFKTSILFDDTCAFQLPPDMIWSVAMATVLALTE